MAILCTLSYGVLQRYRLRATVVYGNWCFYAVSLATYDTQHHHHLYVRLLTACEMVLHPQWYDLLSPSCLLKDDRMATPDVQEAVS